MKLWLWLLFENSTLWKCVQNNKMGKSIRKQTIFLLEFTNGWCTVGWNRNSKVLQKLKRVRLKSQSSSTIHSSLFKTLSWRNFWANWVWHFYWLLSYQWKLIAPVLLKILEWDLSFSMVLSALGIMMSPLKLCLKIKRWQMVMDRTQATVEF